MSLLLALALAEPCPHTPPAQPEGSAQSAARVAIRFYQVAISPADGAGCTFYPSCSHYAWGAIQAHGLLRGAVMSTERLQRAHGGWNYPTCEAGGRTYLYDPVEANAWWR